MFSVVVVVNDKMRLFLTLISLLFSKISFATSTTYDNGSKVEVYVNKVGPFFNPHETYHYYKLPVCRPEKIQHKSLTLGEVLDGDQMAVSLYNIKFGENAKDVELCKLSLNDHEIDQLRDAIEDLYYFEFVIDDIPVRGFVGRLEEAGFVLHSHKIYLWTHLLFNIEYNGDKIIYANVSVKEKVPFSLTEIDGPPYNIRYTYSVNWIPTEVKYADRAKRMSDSSFFPNSLEIHWLSIINSMVLVFILIACVAVILTRVVRNDFTRYNLTMDDMEEEEGKGWKMIHGDVFRFPPYTSLFCAILGVGTQFLVIVIGILLVVLFNLINLNRHGTITMVSVLLYAFTSWIAGFVSASMYKKMGGDDWVLIVNLTSGLFTVPFVMVWSIVNSVAWFYGSTQALPFQTVLLLVTLWAALGYPLAVIGGIAGKSCSCSFDAPIRTKNIPREIPVVAWYRSGSVHCVIGGFLPFSAISVELYYVFATLWGREQYTLYGILFIVFAILLSVTACISVALTYFQLSSEDYRWWWRSVFSAGSTGVFVFIYAMFYYFKRSSMSGTLQMVEFFGYTLLACYIFFLMLGTVSFFSALKFVRYIYDSIKLD